jgi:dTDP-D-glucose 4,6-dehydratase
VLELVERLGRQATFLPERPGEVRRLCLDPNAAAHALRWRAQAPLGEGLERTMRV